jgi:hypothetical protein
MRGAGSWCAPAFATAVLSVSTVCAAATAADSKKVTAVDPDEQLARALNIALSPWGTTVTQVRLEKPAPMEAERARAIAHDTHADVVMWVAARNGRYSVWIYDVAADHTSLRDLTTSPPFDATTAAAVALSIKALLRLTVVAPPAERFGPVARPEPDWAFGVAPSFADHEGKNQEGRQSFVEARASLYASYWPPLFEHHLGAELTLSTSTTGMDFKEPVTGGELTGTLRDVGARLGVGARTPLAKWLAVELSLGATIHVITISDAKLAPNQHGSPASKLSVPASADGGFEPQLAFNIMVFGDVFRVTPWAGVGVLTRWQHFKVGNEIPLEVGPLTIEGGVRAELMAP